MGVKIPISFNRPKLYLCSLSYDGKYCTEFISSLTKTLRYLWLMDIEVEIHYANGEPFIDVGRNKLMTDFLSGDCTHILMIDGDQGWDEKKVHEMLIIDEDILSGAVPVKDEHKEDYMLRIYTNEDFTPSVDEKGLINVERIGGAFLMIKREALIAIKNHNRHRNCLSLGNDYYWFFQAEQTQQVFMGEDFTFCKRAREAGLKIKMLPDIDFKHVGKRVWEGNYHRYLLSQPKS